MGVGAFAAYKAGPLQREAAASYPLFRKAWMRFPFQASVFCGAYYCAGQLQTRIFPKFSKSFYRAKDGRNGISPNSYQANHDLISKFRLFEGNTASADTKTEVESYIDLYSQGPATKADLLNRMADNLPVNPDFANKFQVKRMGKDKDDIFWAFGKIHGLENIAYCSLEDVMKTEGDPMALQHLVDQANDAPKPLKPQCFDACVLDAYCTWITTRQPCWQWIKSSSLKAQT